MLRALSRRHLLTPGGFLEGSRAKANASGFRAEPLEGAPYCPRAAAATLSLRALVAWVAVGKAVARSGRAAALAPPLSRSGLGLRLRLGRRASGFASSSLGGGCPGGLGLCSVVIVGGRQILRGWYTSFFWLYCLLDWFCQEFSVSLCAVFGCCCG